MTGLGFSNGWMIAPLVPIGRGCTGARRYLDREVSLTHVVSFDP